MSPPFDDTPASDAEYQGRETEIAHQIVDDLHSPDVIAAEDKPSQAIRRAKTTSMGQAIAAVKAGEADFAMQALVAWGTGQKEAHEVLKEAETYAAVAGLTSIGNRPF